MGVRVQMEKMKCFGGSLSLRKSLIFYIAAFVMLALALTVVTASICDRTVCGIRESYPVSGEKYYLTNERGERLGEGAFIGNVPAVLTARDERRIALLEVLPTAAAIAYSVSSIIAAVLLFYRNRLKKPLAGLRAASEKISDNDLDFSIRYDRQDELGELVRSFEVMRAALADNFSEMWRQVEERRQLNAAFAHDLRTPLTVLKGYHEMLLTSECEQTREIAVTMGRHLSRMEAYVDSMSRLRRLEDMEPEYEEVFLPAFLSSLEESARILCVQNGKKLYLNNGASDGRLSIDRAFISQVCNNLMANAVRYARDAVTLSFSLQDRGLLLTVADDGKGFDPDSVQEAVKPYFTQESDRSEHFGLGLYISKLLCGRHGGCLKIENTADGAKVSAFFGGDKYKK